MGDDGGVSFARLAEIVGADPLDLEELKLAGKQLKEIPDLFPCKRLRRVDLAGNGLESLECVSGLREVSWLSAKDNQIEDIGPLLKLVKMAVLNIGSNKITTLEALKRMASLKALVANNNNIASLTGLASCHQLNTIVLSHNPIAEISGIPTLKHITKLSFGHCQIRTIPDLTCHPLLEELRLNDNKISKVPETLDRNPSLKVLDLGKNRLHDIGDIFRISQCRHLSNLNLLGNTRLVEQAGYKDKVVGAMPSLVILDGRRLDGERGGKGKYRHKEGYVDPRSFKKGREGKVGAGAAREGKADKEGDMHADRIDKGRQGKRGLPGGKAVEERQETEKQKENPFEAFARGKQQRVVAAAEAEQGGDEGGQNLSAAGQGKEGKPAKRKRGEGSSGGNGQEAADAGDNAGVAEDHGGGRTDAPAEKKKKKKKVVEVKDGWESSGSPQKQPKKEKSASKPEEGEGDAGKLAKQGGEGASLGVVAVRKLSGKPVGVRAGKDKKAKFTPAHGADVIAGLKGEGASVGMGGASAWD